MIRFDILQQLNTNVTYQGLRVCSEALLSLHNDYFAYSKSSILG